MLLQYMALSVSFVCVCVQKNLCVHSLGYIVGASAPPVKIFVSVRWVTSWDHPSLCVSVQLVTLWVRPPLVCVLSLEDKLSLDPFILSTPVCGIFLGGGH